MELTFIDKAEFDTLSNAEKRVKICEDVVARIKANKIIPNGGSFINSYITPNDHNSLKESINARNCEACAKGALFCSWVGNFNEVTVSRYLSTHALEETHRLKEIAPELVEVFGEVMLDNIEAAFETQIYHWHYDEHETAKYMYAFSDYDLMGIMEYIIKHKGDFPLPVGSF